MIIIEIVFDFNYPLSVYTTKYLQTLTYVFFLQAIHHGNHF